MNYKIVARMVQLTADANPNKRWMSTYLGVIEADTPSQTDSDPMMHAIVQPYEMMCAVVNDFIHDRFAEAILDDIKKIESGSSDVIENGTEAYMFWLARESVIFEFQYGENGPEEGGEVTLAQFKLAVQTYLQFLRDPERKPIEVPFPK